ncbi:hypothetical protein [Citrobacter sp. A316]|uniref:hypothetical protein n=1 Tax=Citrobacter sp. A316 TaxID=1639132 RepID=UPI00111B9E5A|nr:hypothetical protein [Citrobacter sp. A316]
MIQGLRKSTPHYIALFSLIIIDFTQGKNTKKIQKNIKTVEMFSQIKIYKIKNYNLFGVVKLYFNKIQKNNHSKYSFSTQ